MIRRPVLSLAQLLRALFFFIFFPAVVLASPSLNEDSLLLVQPIFDAIIQEESISVYHVQGQYLLPLGAVAALTGLDIRVTPQDGTAVGKIVDTKTFRLDSNQRKVTLAGKEKPFSAGSVVANEEDIFIEKSVFESWFPLRFTVDLQHLTVAITATELLPVQQKALRERQWQVLKTQQHPKSSYQEKTIPYQLMTWPFADISAGYDYRRAATQQSGGYNYSIQAGGDMGYLNTALFASGESDHALAMARFSAGRKDSGGNLLGPFNATAFSLGDITSLDTPLVAASGEGRGVMVSNRELDRSAMLDVTNLVGNATPGWDVELYRNGILLDVQHIVDNGRYEFANVPVLYGTNIFRTIFYGPQGQRYEETRQLLTDENILHKGEFSYAFSVDEKSRNFLPVSRESPRIFSLSSFSPDGEETTEIVRQQQGVRAISNMEYGITDKVTMAFGAAHIPLAVNTHDYITAGLRTTVLKGILASQDIAYDMAAKGVAEKTTLLTNVKTVNIKAEHSVFSNFINDASERAGKKIQAVSLGDISVPVPYTANMNTGIIARRQRFAGGETELSLLHRLSASLYRMSVTNVVGRVETDGAGMKNVTTEGQAALSGTIKELHLRATGNYLLPGAKVTAIGLSAQKRIKENLVWVGQFTKNTLYDHQTILSSSLNWDVRKVKLSLKLDTDSEGQAFIGTNVSFSLAREPATKKWHMQGEPIAAGGGVSTQAFLDKNGNNMFDKEDEWINNTAFKVGAKKIRAEDGSVAFGVGLPPDVVTDITIDEGSLEDPLWICNQPGYRVRSRAGIITPLTFPVVASSEIDGNVMVVTEGGNKPLPRIGLELLDQSGHSIQKAKTEFDGFYVFERVLPGDYTLTVVREELEKRHLRGKPYRVHIVGTGDVYSDRNFILEAIQ